MNKPYPSTGQIWQLRVASQYYLVVEVQKRPKSGDWIKISPLDKPDIYLESFVSGFLIAYDYESG